MLTVNRIADVFDIKKRFLRSTHLERDFTDRTALRGYVVTPLAKEGFERLAQGLSPKSGQRAWRITGDYGTGKSSFALALAHLLQEEGGGLPPEVRKCVDFRSLGVKRPNLMPVLVTGTRAPLGESLRLALARSLEEVCSRGKPPQLLARLRAISGKHAGLQDGSDEIALLEEARQYAPSDPLAATFSQVPCGSSSVSAEKSSTCSRRRNLREIRRASAVLFKLDFRSRAPWALPTSPAEASVLASEEKPNMRYHTSDTTRYCSSK